MIDTVDRLLKSTLDALCPNVARLFFRGKAGTYITYQLVSSEDMAAADDETHGTEYTYRVDIYSKRDYIALLRRVKQALKAAGFYGLVIDPEVYEQDTGFYHVPIEAKYYEQTEVLKLWQLLVYAIFTARRSPWAKMAKKHTERPCAWRRPLARKCP